MVSPALSSVRRAVAAGRESRAQIRAPKSRLAKFLHFFVHLFSTPKACARAYAADVLHIEAEAAAQLAEQKSDLSSLRSLRRCVLHRAQ